MVAEAERVKVVVRCRPLSSKEEKVHGSSLVDIIPSANTIRVRSPCKYIEPKSFTLDAVYGPESTQEEIYKETIDPFVRSVLEGFNATVFAYGQTGAGKTYTMEGSLEKNEDVGLMPRCFIQLFDNMSAYSEGSYKVKCSYIEIYQDEVLDLLVPSDPKQGRQRSGTTELFLNGLMAYECKNAATMYQMMQFGNTNRRTGKTEMNESSSRSHAIFTITVYSIGYNTSGAKITKMGKLNLVDLAGSERLKKSHSTGQTQKEAAKINLSLTALGRVITALTDSNSKHIPYRDSILTKVLHSSLGGNSKTLMIANIGPSEKNYGEIIDTLMFAKRAKLIKNIAIPNVEEERVTNPEHVSEPLTKDEGEPSNKPTTDQSTMTTENWDNDIQSNFIDMYFKFKQYSNNFIAKRSVFTETELLNQSHQPVCSNVKVTENKCTQLEEERREEAPEKRRTNKLIRQPTVSFKAPTRDITTNIQQDLLQPEFQTSLDYLQQKQNEIDELREEEVDIQRTLNLDTEGSPTFKYLLALLYRKSLEIVILRYKMCKHVVDYQIGDGGFRMIELLENRMKMVKQIRLFNKLVRDTFPLHIQSCLLVRKKCLTNIVSCFKKHEENTFI